VKKESGKVTDALAGQAGMLIKVLLVALLSSVWGAREDNKDLVMEVQGVGDSEVVFGTKREEEGKWVLNVREEKGSFSVSKDNKVRILRADICI
jgi:hypothetical protein